LCSLFLLYINDLPENVKANAKLFADDCLLYKEINNISDGQDLQNDLKALESWENEWQMSFNADKCFIIAAGTKSHLCRGEKVTAQGLFLEACLNLRMQLMILRCPKELVVSGCEEMS
jgi:hypothetical protein